MESELVLPSQQDPTPAETSAIPSPFIPGTSIQYAWDSTSLGWLKSCPRLYQYYMIDGWIPKGESVHLRFGIEYHRALQDYEHSIQAGADHAAAMWLTVRDTILRMADYDLDHKYKNKTNLLRTVIWYLDKHKDDKITTVIKPDGTAAVELSFRFELDYGPEWCEDQQVQQPYLLCGHLDRVVDFNGAKFVMDYKTTKSQPSEFYFSQYSPDNQMTLYSIAGQVVMDSPIRGVLVSAAQVLIDWSEFGRGITYRSKDAVTEWLGDLRYWLRQAERFAEDNYWPMNDKYCNAYRSEETGAIGCPFREICSLSPQVRGDFLKSNFDKRDPWNPLEPR